MRDNLNLIIGEDKKKQDFYIFNILNKITDDSDKIEIDMNEKNILDVIEEASMMSLFSKNKIIIGNNLDIDKLNDNELEEFEKYVKKNNDNVYIIFIAKKVDARKKSYKLFKDNFKIITIDNEEDSEIPYEFVSNKLKEKKYKMDNSNINYFLSKTGADINDINNELDKLMIYKINDKVITRDDIDCLILDRIDNVIYEFTNAILDKNYDKVMEMYNNFMVENISVDYLISSVYGSVRTCLVVKLLNEDNKSNLEIAKFIGKKEYYVKKTLERIYRYSVNDLTNFILELNKVDIGIKSGKNNIDMFLKFLLEYV